MKAKNLAKALCVLLAALLATPAAYAQARRAVGVEGMRYRTPQELRLPGGSVVAKTVVDGRLVLGAGERIPVQGLAYFFPDEDTLKFLIAVQYEEGRLRARVFLIAREGRDLVVAEETALKVGEGPKVDYGIIAATLQAALRNPAQGPGWVRSLRTRTRPLFASDSAFGAGLVSFLQQMGASEPSECIPHYAWSFTTDTLVVWYWCVSSEERRPGRPVWYYVLEIPPRAP